jgi:hypothetical protein
MYNHNYSHKGMGPIDIFMKLKIGAYVEEKLI